MVKLNYTLKAATLIESLIAMVIIVVSVCVATMIYSNVLDSDKQRLQLRAVLLINQESIKTKNEKKYIDQTETTGDWTIKKTIEHYNQSDNLYALTIAVSDKEGKLIAQQHELIIIE